LKKRTRRFSAGEKERGVLELLHAESVRERLEHEIVIHGWIVETAGGQDDRGA